MVGLAAEQFVAGVCLLSFNFWNATYVMYGEAADWRTPRISHHRRRFRCRGLRGALGGPAGVHQEGIELNVLTRSWASFLLFFAIELVALAVVLFGGLLASMA